MPNLNEFIGPIPTQESINSLERISGVKPCAKCDLDSQEYYWDPNQFIISWTCPGGHSNSVKVNG